MDIVNKYKKHKEYSDFNKSVTTSIDEINLKIANLEHEYISSATLLTDEDKQTLNELSSKLTELNN